MHHLAKYIYDLVLAARQHNMKTVEILKNRGFTGGNVEPCLYMKQSVKDRVYIALYIDDNLMVGNTDAIDEVVALLQEMD